MYKTWTVYLYSFSCKYFSTRDSIFSELKKYVNNIIEKRIIVTILGYYSQLFWSVEKNKYRVILYVNDAFNYLLTKWDHQWWPI